jgi:hypothetical protein
MSLRRIGFIGAAACLGLGIVGTPALAWADSGSPGSSAAAAPTVTQDASGTWTVALPGVGTLSFTIDPSTGSVTGLTVTPAVGSGFTAGTPTVTTEGVEVVFSSGTTSEVLQVKVEQEDGVPTVTAEVQVPDTESGDQTNGTTGSSDGTEGGTSDGGDSSSSSGDDGQDNAASATSSTTTTSTPTNSSSDDGSDSSGSDGSSGDQSASTTTTTTTPTTGSTSGSDGSSSGTSGSGGDSGSGDGAGGSGDGSSGSDG